LDLSLLFYSVNLIADFGFRIADFVRQRSFFLFRYQSFLVGSQLRKPIKIRIPQSAIRNQLTSSI
jgi:hypothetical protein